MITQQKGVICMKKKFCAILVAAMVAASPFTALANSSTSGSPITGIQSWGQLSYVATYARGTTQISAAGYVYVGVTAYCLGDTARKTNFASATDNLLAEATAYNYAATQVVGAKGSHIATYGWNSWSGSTILGTTW